MARTKIAVFLTHQQLLDIEYAGVNSWNYEESGCPVCHVAEDATHKDSCWIGAALKEVR